MDSGEDWVALMDDDFSDTEGQISLKDLHSEENTCKMLVS